MTKKCRRCKKRQPHKNFFKRTASADGLAMSCKACQKEVNSAYHRTPKGIYDTLVSVAKRRDLKMKLTMEEVNDIRSAPCMGCGELNPPQMGSGLDRIDSRKGYIPGNVVACCSTCNMMKGALSMDDFLSHIDKIKNHHLKAKVSK